MPIQWTSDYKLGIKIIDLQHKRFIGILNMLYEAIHTFNTKEKIPEIFEKLRQYIILHFATEEKYFDAFAYEDSQEHKNKHKEFIQHIESLQKDTKQDAMGVSFKLVDFLEDWLVDHLNTLDKKYVECFHSHGLY